MSWSADTLLDVLAGAMGRERFLAEAWGRRGCALPGPPGRFAGLLDRAGFERLAPRAGVLKAAFHDTAGWYVDVPIQAAQVKRLYSAGMTICAGMLPEEDGLAAFLAAFRGAVLGAGASHCNAYLSPEGRGFALHFDNHPVLVLQAEGRKRWRFTPEPETGLPMVANITLPPDRDLVRLPWGEVRRPAPERFEEVVLAPGDALYLPAGAWHEAKAEGGASLGVTVAIQQAPLLDLLRGALAPLLAAEPAFGGGLPPVADGPAAEARLEAMLAALRAAAARLTTAGLRAAWRAGAASPQGGAASTQGGGASAQGSADRPAARGGGPG